MSDLPKQSHVMAQWIADNEIGSNTTIMTPFGVKPLVYADYTASGRSLTAVEKILQEQVMPYYANTHSESSFTGSHTTAWREAARQMIKEAVNASANDRVVFCGSGATAAINRLIQLLGLEKGGSFTGPSQDTREANRPVVFIGPYEHHSNELPWRESEADVISIPLNKNGQIDVTELSRRLKEFADRPLLVGSFSAASNVTGILTDVKGITRILKENGALACWDYAAAAAYCPIDMSGDPAIDAVFISTHKLPGGPGTPGLLIAKSDLFRNTRPGMPGGGTVSFVSPDSHEYLHDLERKEEGGTPAILESVRAGLVFSIRSQLAMEEIKSTELALAQRVISRLKQHPGIEIVGDSENPRLPILSLRFWHRSKQLHYGFIVALLNDLFGIQARGGCSCAGPYAHHLLGINKQQSLQLLGAMQAGDTVLRPGWVRINFTYFMNESVIDYILTALEMLADEAINLLPQYHYNQARGIWVHERAKTQYQPDFGCLDWVKQSVKNVNGRPESSSPRLDLSTFIVAAKAELTPENTVDHINNRAVFPLSTAFESLRWFWVAEDLS